MDSWGWEQLDPWLHVREWLPVGGLFCIINGPSRGRPWTQDAVRVQLRRAAAHAAMRRRFAPHQLRHAHAVEMARFSCRSVRYRSLEGAPNTSANVFGTVDLCGSRTNLQLWRISLNERAATCRPPRDASAPSSGSSWSVQPARYPPPLVASAPTLRGSRTGRTTRWPEPLGELVRGWAKPRRRRAGRRDEQAAGCAAKRSGRLRRRANRLRMGSTSHAKRALTHSAQTSECSRWLRRRPPPQPWRWSQRARSRPVTVVTTRRLCKR
jgi:hypothetical protein